MALTAVSGHWRRRAERMGRGIFLGFDTETQRAAYLGMNRLFTHLHVLGPPGVGKTRVLLNIWQQLTDLDACVILINPKGSLGTMARDWAVAQGLTARLTYFDPGDPTHVVGYNPLRRNGSIPLNTQAKAVREALRSAWGQSDFSQTPQLARVLFWALSAALELGLTLVEALDMIRPRSPLRERYLTVAVDPYVQEALAYFDGLRESRQDELAASSLARLEAFVLDPTIRRIFSQQERSLDLSEIIQRRGLFIVNLEQYRPLRADDVRLIGRLVINDVLARVFSRPGHERRTPVILMLDEVQTFLTEDLATALDQGRELGLGCILAHQHMGQFEVDEASRRLAPSVENCARTKIVFGGLSVQEMAAQVDNLFLDRLDPWIVKDEIVAQELEPVEEVRASYSLTSTRGGSRAHTRGVQASHTASRHRANTSARGTATARAASALLGQNRATAHTRTNGEGMVAAHGSHRGTGTTIIPDVLGDDGSVVVPAHVIETDSGGSSESQSENYFEADSESASTATMEASTWSQVETDSTTTGEQTGTGEADSKGTSTADTEGIQESESVSVTYSPFMTYRVSERVSSRTFLGLDEQRLGWMQRLAAQPTGHFVLKCPDSPAVFLRAAYVGDPIVNARLLARARERFLALPYVAPVAVVDQEDRVRRDALLARPVARKPPRSSDDESF